jgi:hypothetical protein
MAGIVDQRSRRNEPPPLHARVVAPERNDVHLHLDEDGQHLGHVTHQLQ